MIRLLTIAALAASLAGTALAQTTAPAPAKPTAPVTAPAKPTTPPPVATTPVKPTKPVAQLVDINTASVDELTKLKGVGPARAQAIVKGRPYRGKDEILTKKIVPKNVYEDIKDMIVARQKN
jgi:DNA uptake protein ComE-like DNA-binding protein